MRKNLATAAFCWVLLSACGDMPPINGNPQMNDPVTITVAWDPNPPAEQVKGYVLHYGPTSRKSADFNGYSTQINVGNVTRYSVAIPDTERTYLAVTAFNDAGLTSDYSEEIYTDPSNSGSPTQHTITASAGTGGSISPFGSVPVAYGGDQVFVITPNHGYWIADILVDGKSVGAVNSYTFSNVTAGRTIAASFSTIATTTLSKVAFPVTGEVPVAFEPDTLLIAASYGTGGTISPSGAVSVSQGNSQKFFILASPGYEVADVLVDGNSVGAVSSYTFSSVDWNRTIEALFMVVP